MRMAAQGGAAVTIFVAKGDKEKPIGERRAIVK